MDGNKTIVPFAFDRSLWYQGGIVDWINWDYHGYPHGLIIGGTGTGKTFAVKLLLARIAYYVPCAEIIVCDYKADDFRFLDGHRRYFGFNECRRGLNAFYWYFEKRQSGEDTTRNFRLLVFDEWGAFLSMLDKKEAEAAKAKLGTLLMLGRSFNVHVIVSQQRADATYFSAGARDQFSFVLAMGNLTKEAAQMFGFDREAMTSARKPGEGHILFSGVDLRSIIVPQVRCTDRLEAAISVLCGSVVIPRRNPAESLTDDAEGGEAVSETQAEQSEHSG